MGSPLTLLLWVSIIILLGARDGTLLDETVCGCITEDEASSLEVLVGTAADSTARSTLGLIELGWSIVHGSLWGPVVIAIRFEVILLGLALLGRSGLRGCSESSPTGRWCGASQPCLWGAIWGDAGQLADLYESLGNGAGGWLRWCVVGYLRSVFEGYNER